MNTVIPVRAFNDNYIWVVLNGKHAVLVDAGDPAPVMAYLARENLIPLAILCTHHHQDHSGGNRELSERYSIDVYGPPSAPGVTVAVSDGDTIDLPGFSFGVLDVPGHTLEHAAFLGDGKLFCGDALFGCGCGRIFEGTAAMMHASLQKLAHLPPDTQVYPAHEYTLANIRFALAVEADNGKLAARALAEREKQAHDQPTLPSTIDLELATNPFLRCRENSVREATEAHCGRLLLDECAVFTELRQWRNDFR